ncbi:beta-N-acetylhexosaminidase [Paenibacillus sp. JDR-2]|uniref:beta-N-acetylhexosaminidase n=1 Tax=Paenibacillus sp. (strain JDR-2) TaxID=324057 RepID=UPI00016665A5|nr:family 20 glycosylhydrolase [Paenibacillus sp. JDR-2]ACT02260.1 Glycoside hydrolase, family 20, catalytic core [Paenibacillus sp. JDR-2]
MITPVYLYPQPRIYKAGGESSPAAVRFAVRSVEQEAARMAEKLDVANRLAAHLAAKGSTALPATPIIIEHHSGLHPQGYVLEWSSNGLRLAASTAQGLNYAILTAGQMMDAQRGEWVHCLIEDEPDFPVRGVMLDIGRNKIPKMDTLFACVDRISELKFNHLQLYMEGYSFHYEKYSALFPDATPLTAAEYRELDAYAAERFVDLVPSQNCLGHMWPWLSKPELRDLAEHPDGMPTPLPFKLPPTTMNPADKRSTALAKDLFDELLPNFSSEYVNLNMDEPFGLGTGASKERAEKIGVGRLYMEFAEQMFAIARSHGKKPMMWGDVLMHHPELVNDLSDDVTVLHWNYDAPIPYEPHCRRLQEHNIRYYVCPGTSGWSSIAGRTDNMLGNIADAGKNGKAYGASGLIVADWGDGGHWQVPAVSYPGYAYAAGTSWQLNANLDQWDALKHHVSLRMLHDRSGIGGELLMTLGRYYLLERCTIENATYTNYLINHGLSSQETLERDTKLLPRIAKLLGGAGTPFELDYRYSEMKDWFSERRKEMEALELFGADSVLVKDELLNTLRLIEQGAGLHRYIYQQELADPAAKLDWLKYLHAELHTAMDEFNRLWLVRNREGGLAESTAAFRKLLKQYEEQLEQ